MEDLKAKEMISTDHHFRILPPEIQNEIQSQNYFWNELENIGHKIPELDSSKGM